MNKIDLDYLRTWIGKSRSDKDLISCRHARLLAATLDYSSPEEITDGESLPPLWHWTCFLEGAPTHGLGNDGHPARGGFMPPVGISPVTSRVCASRTVSMPSEVVTSISTE